jgi:ribosomal protein S18 acetylase RimI-like enzyme
MDKFYLRNLVPADAPRLGELFRRYREQWPVTRMREIEFYLSHPAFEQGKNIFCAFDPPGNMLGSGLIFPVLVQDDAPAGKAHHLWLMIVADPRSSRQTYIKNLLFARILARAKEIKKGLAAGHRELLLGASLFSSELDMIHYFVKKQFVHNDSVYIMHRDLREPVPRLPQPPGVTVKEWRIETEEDQQKYLKAENAAFPHAPKNPEGLRHFLRSSIWNGGGTSFSAFADNGEVVGSVMVYGNPHAGRRVAFTEDIFVLPPWQRRGIASYLIRQGLAYLQRQGVRLASLEVRSRNDNALNIYKRLGYKVVHKQLLLMRKV